MGKFLFIYATLSISDPLSPVKVRFPLFYSVAAERGHLPRPGMLYFPQGLPFIVSYHYSLSAFKPTLHKIKISCKV